MTARRFTLAQSFTCRELSLMAESYLVEHREELLSLVQPLAEQILRKR